MTTLRALALESNLFSGTLPPEIGRLVNLETLIISVNNLTGEFPRNLTRLSKLVQLRISSNNFTGRIPDYFQRWTQLTQLEIQASGLQGPIPASISLLKNLTELRINDLNGGDSVFPNLSNMTSLLRLMLRGCNLSGLIPDLSAMTDVYSFGVVALEIVAGKNKMKFRPKDDFVCLVDWALVLQQNGNVKESSGSGQISTRNKLSEWLR